ncbi:MAG TPA: long-chain fatty acid--CoA ligase [Stackebrandtia sp.]|jgi:long-chain acyl-CoA synthetase|uniref:long-chain-fatty-acid--CoA ligase n=1 Tax=Stackebrandtia sp. TaxID=2023065 RepID=UPI002D35839A|nr:long-chain fatty acid--CoA ligase [Stackebrandtia sp.]HZE38182.1 long-chain fatty acid--CoA ligase [Stackebrandtia sp.]
MLNLAMVLEDSARAKPDHEAVILGDTRLTYAQVDAASNQVANALNAKGIGHGDKVALMSPNLPYFPIVYFGVLKTGATVVPLNVLMTTREIAYFLTDSRATAFFCFEGTEELPMGRRGFDAFDQVGGCEHFVMLTADPGGASPRPGVPTLAEFTAGQSPAYESAPTSETDTAVVLYTSGTTGQPKGAELTHSNIVQNSLLNNRMFRATPDEIALVTLPLFHVFGQVVQLTSGFANGTTLVLVPRFDPDAVLSLMERENVTVFAGVPTMYWALLHHQGEHDLAAIAANLRVAVSGGSALPLEVLRGFEKRFGVPILEGYGLSETSPVATFNRLDIPRRPGSIGKEVWGTRAKIVREDGSAADVDEPGEIVVRGHHVMKGYLGRPAETAEILDADGWFHTGDIGTQDADGYIFVVDRLKDMIIRNGLNVYPREVEEVLMTHPGVSLAAVVGVPHETHGEEIKAFVIRESGVDVSAEELIAWARENMAAYKYPRGVEFRDSLPMTASGKILKRELKDG